MIKKLMMMLVATMAATGAWAMGEKSVVLGDWYEALLDNEATTCARWEDFWMGASVAIPVTGLASPIPASDVVVTAGTYSEFGRPYVLTEAEMWDRYGAPVLREKNLGNVEFDWYDNVWQNWDAEEDGAYGYELSADIWPNWSQVSGRQWILIPTGVPRSGTHTFSVKINGVEHSNYVVSFVMAEDQKPVPYVYKVSASVAESCEAMGKVTGGKIVKPGEQLTLTATPNKGYIFDGWYDAEGNPFPNDRDFRLAQLPYMVGQSDVEVYAKFAKLSGNVTVSAKAEAGMVFAGWYTDDAFAKHYVPSDGKDYRTASMSYPVPLYAALFPRFVLTDEDMQISLTCSPKAYYDANSPMSLGVLVDSCSLPTVTAANLPTGLKFDAKTLMISGTPTKPGEGKDVKFTVKNLTNKQGATFAVSIKIGDAKAPSLPDLKYNDADGYAPFVPGASQDMAEVLGASTMDVLSQGGWTVTGLPAGIKFDSKTGKFSGAPTKANENCTVTFKKGTEVATITLRTGDLPPLNITSYLIDEGNDFPVVIPESRAKDFKVTGAGGYAVGKAATLSATAPKGYVFAGWYADEMCTIPAENSMQDYRTANSYKFTMPEEATSETGARLYAMFIHASHDFAGVEDLSDWGDGITVEINQSESMPADFIKNCVFSGSLPTVAVKGLPAGLKFDAKTLLLSGKATDKTPKWYDLIVSVKNAAGYTFTGIFGVSVNGGTPAEDIDDLGISCQLDWLDYLYVGDIVMDESCFGTSSDGVTGVTGLPAEMKLYKETEDGETFFLVAEVNDEMPVIKTPGVYTITVNGKKDGKAAKTTKRFVIRDNESIYERVAVANGCENMGSVTGNGTVVHPGTSFSINATAKKGYVFAGWYADPDCHSRAFFMPEFADFRQASQKAASISIDTGSEDLDIALAPTVLNPTTWYAKFVEKSVDSEVRIRDVIYEEYPGLHLGEFVYDFDLLKDDEFDVEIQLAVESESLPTITFKNLPSWMDKDSHQYFDGFWLWYNGKSEPVPGEYSFTMTAKNASGAVDEKKLTIRVPNYRNEDLPFDYENGYTLVPGVVFTAEMLMAPWLDLRGWTVTGLPDGMKFDPETGKFTGAPTKPNTSYTVWFKKTGEETATITMRTKSFPVLELEPIVAGHGNDLGLMLDESVEVPDISKFKLTGAGAYAANKDVTLGATTPAGWVFAGWQEVESQHLGIGMCPDFADMTLDARTNDTRIAAYKFKMPATERMRLRGIFIHQSQDELLSMMATPGMTMHYTLNSGEDIVQSMNHMAVMAVRNCFMSYQMVSSFPTVTVKGLPTGLKFDAKNLILSGKVTAKAGHYYATFTAKNLSGYTLTVPVKFIVSDMHQPLSPEDPSDVNTMPPEFFFDEFNKLENLVAGLPIGYEDSYENWGYMIPGTEIAFGHPGCPEGGLLSFSGLPKGMTAKGDTSYTDSVGTFKEWWIEGVPTEAGWYTVSATGKGYDGFEIENYKYSKHIAVAETPSKYVFVKVAQGEGTVTGSGVWNAGKSYSINATPKAGYVFAGWYQDEMCTDPAQNWTFGNECDYRKASQKWTLEAEFLRMMPGPDALYAKFVPNAEDDSDVEVIAIGSYSESGWDSADIYNEYWSILSEDFIWYINPTEDGYAGDELGLLINSVTEPTVTVKGLPKEFEFEGTYADGLYVIECDGSPAPGEYIAELTVKTATLKNPVTFKFAVRVPHYRHWELPLDYDNGYTLIPGATFDYDMLLPGVDLTGWTVTGLPAGMTFDANTGRIRGAPTAADKSYTVWFKRGDETASVTMRTSALPKLEVVASLYDGVYNTSLEGVKLSGSGSYAANASVTLSATAPKGWVFAGWYGGEHGEFSLENGTQDYRTASGYKFVMPEDIPYDGVVRVVAKFAPVDFDFARVYDEDSSYISVVAGEPLPFDFIKYAVESLSLPTVTVKGLPTGVSFNAKTFELTGAVADTMPKWYDLIVSVKNVSGYMYTGIFGISVNGGMPEEDIDELGISWQLDWLDQLRVGDRVIEESCFGSVADGVTGVTGLPKELSVFKEAEDYDEPVFLLAEVENDMPFIKTPGVYTVVVNGNRDGKALKTTKRIVIRDSESVYVRVAAADGCESMGSVSGDGAVVHPGETFQINATPKAGYVFAGWYYDSFCMYDKALNPYRDWEYDYRTAQQKWMAGYAIYGDWTYSTPINLYAKFMPLQEADQNITVLAGYYWDSPYGLPELESGNSFTVMSDWGGWYMNLQFMSDTLPEVTVTGLPAGIYIDTPLWSDGEAEFYCEDVGAVKPGVYDVTLKVKNKNTTREYNFSLVVPLQRTSAIFDGILDVTDEGMPFNVGVTPDLNFWNLGPDVVVSATGLPTGMTLQKDSSGLYALSGAPTQAGNYTVTFTATCDGRKETQMVFFRVQALPDWTVGTFNGDGDFVNPKDPDGDWMGGVSTLTVSKTGALSGKVIYSINGKQVTATMQASAFSKNVDLDYETVLRLTDIDEYDGESPAMPYQGATAYVYEDISVSVPGYGTFSVDVYLYQVSYGDDGESIGIIRTIQCHNKIGLEDDVSVQFEGVQNLWERKSEVIDLPVFDDNLLNWAHGKKSHWCGDYEFTFGDRGKLTVVYHNPYGAKQTASAQILVDGIDDGGTYLAWTVVSFPQIDEMVWFAIDLTPDERGLVSTDGIDIWED